MFVRKKLFQKGIFLFGALIGSWFLLRHGLAIGFPFLLGAGLALAAEPMVALLVRRGKLPRWLAAGIGVTMVLVLLVALSSMLIAAIVRQAGNLAQIMPDLVDATRRGLDSLQSWLLRLASHAPGDLRQPLTDAVTSLFSGSSTVMDGLTDKVLGMATGLLGHLAQGAFGFFTAILASYLFSAKLPPIRAFLRQRTPPVWQQRYLPALKELKQALVGWLTAQLKLTGITLVLLIGGFWLLRIPHGPVWAILVALVDAFPILGTGTVLIPWSLICLLQGQQARGIGLLGIYAVAWLTRSILEPKLLGKELGLDPLVTLAAMYAGARLFGLLGMIASPILAVAVIRLAKASVAP